MLGLQLGIWVQGKDGRKPTSLHRGAHVCAFCRKIGHSYVKCRNAPGAREEAPTKN